MGMLAAWLAPAWADKDKTYNPQINRADFVGVIDNPYSPLAPSTTLTYEVQTGIVMLADPQPNASYRQEFLAGVAEDMAAVLRCTTDQQGYD